MVPEGNPSSSHPLEAKERPRVGDLYFLWNPTTENFSGYGLVTEEDHPDRLVGLLMVDRPQPADPQWLAKVEAAYGEYRLIPMTKTDERGILCQMQIVKDSLPYLRSFPNPKSSDIRVALKPLLDEPPNPVLKVRWNPLLSLWQSDFWIGLPQEMQAMFIKTGYGSFAAESKGIVSFVTYAPDEDIESFRRAPVLYRWELIQMPTAPLIRFRATILDDPRSPYALEHFLNTSDLEQARILSRLIEQKELSFDFFGAEFEFRYSKHLDHPIRMREQLRWCVQQAKDYWATLDPEERDFDLAKAEFQRRWPL